MPKHPEAIRRQAQRESRQAAALRANLSRRKDQQRQQAGDVGLAAGSPTPEPAPAADPDLAPDPPHR